MNKIMKRFIGFYDYTVVLTFLSLISSVYGITCAVHDRYKTAILCLAISGILDAFDGRVARSKKNRTEDERAFGIQLDSLCDIVCFGVFPALICYLIGMRGFIGLTIVFLYCLCALIRLAYFNVLEENRQKEEGGGCNKVYHGLPVTSIAYILPLTFWLQFILPANKPYIFIILLHVVMAVTAVLFVLDFPLPKPGIKSILIMAGVVGVTVGIIFAYTKLRIPKEREYDNDTDDTANAVVYDISY